MIKIKQFISQLINWTPEFLLFTMNSELWVEDWYFLLHRTVPVVLDRIVGPSLKVFGDFSPFISLAVVVEEEDPFFFFRPLGFLDHRIQMIVPSLSTLFTYSSREILSNWGPFPWSSFLNKHYHKFVLKISPRAFDQFGVQNFLPSMKTLYISSALELESDFLPTFSLVLSNRLF